MNEFIAMLKLYSVQVVMAVAGLNTIIAAIPDVPWWVILGVNICGVIAHHVARSTPQPEVVAKIAAVRASAQKS